MKKPTKKELYEKLNELNKIQLDEQKRKEQEQTKKYMLYYEGAYKKLREVLINAFSGSFSMIKFEHVDGAGFWFSFELVQDKTRQTYRIDHDEAQKKFFEIIKGDKKTA